MKNNNNNNQKKKKKKKYIKVLSNIVYGLATLTRDVKCSKL